MSTSNYQLNQWDAKDRILREDFNADNAKIDAILTEQTTAQKNLVEKIDAVETKAGAQLLKNITLTSTCSTYSLPLSDIDWAQWKAVHISVAPYTSSGCVISFYANSQSSSRLMGTCTGNYSSTASSRHNFHHLLLYPLFDERRYVKAISLGYDDSNDTHYYSPGIYFQEFTSLHVICNSGYQMYAGTAIQVWGEK